VGIVRGLPVGTIATVEGVLTTRLGALESGRSGFVQDASGGIAVYLDAAVVDGPPAGSLVRLTGTLDTRYAQTTLRTAIDAVTVLGTSSLPAPAGAATGSIGEPIEGTRVLVAGVVTESPESMADGLGLLVDDGSGAVRVIVGPDALGSMTVGRGMSVVASGPIGQRDSTGTGTSGYRLYSTLPGELEVTATPSPSPSPTPSSSPTPSASPTPSQSSPATGTPTPSPSVTPSSTATPSPTPAPVLAIADARAQGVGARVTVRGVVTAEAGRLGTPPLVAIADETAGIMVRLPDDVSRPNRGTIMTVSGKLAAPYGQLEVRPAAAVDVAAVGSAALPAPIAITATELGESVEAALVTLEATVDQSVSKATSGDLSVGVLETESRGRVKIYADASSGIRADDLPRGARLRFNGIVGQRATRSGRLDGYRIWLRDRSDIVVVVPAPAATPRPTQTSAPTGSHPIVTIARALRSSGQDVRVIGTVTAARSIDRSGRLVVIQDSTAGIEVKLPQASGTPSIGRRLEVSGRVGRAYGAPRIDAKGVVNRGTGAPVLPTVLHASPGTAHEWRLVRAEGVVSAIHRTGERWKAELLIGTTHLLVAGTTDAAIPVTALAEGHRATVIGVVVRPYPTANDRRFSIDPRSAADIRLGGLVAGGSNGSPLPGGSAGGAIGPGGPGSGPGGGGQEPGTPLDIDLAQLGEHLGANVRVGGFVTGIDSSGITIDDGTASGRIELAGEATAYLALLGPDEAINATGLVGGTTEAPVLNVSDAAGIVRVNDLGGSLDPYGEATADPDPSAATVPGQAGLTGLPGLDGATAAGLGSLIVISLVSLFVTYFRRRRIRRALSQRVAARLATLGARPPTHESRLARVDSLENAGLSSAEFRASEASR
jgi:hypothetical protein